MSKKSLFTKMEHIGLGAVDTAALAAWYQHTFDLLCLFQAEGDNQPYFLTDANRSFVIEIFPVEALSEHVEHAVHLCFYTEDITTAIADLKAKGVQGIGEIKTLGTRGKTVFFPDPANHTVQVVHRPTALWNS